MRRCWGIFSLIFISVLSLAISVAAPAADLARARELYQRTQYQQALQALEGTPDNRAAVYELIGKTYYMLEDYKKATEALEKAVELEPKNSDYFDWLGKIYGKRAETSSVATAWSYAGKCRRNFERAIELDPRNLEAIDDLVEFALNAPGMLGGGMDRAAAVAEQSKNLSPEKYHSLQARIAEKRKDFAGEEKHLRLALEAAPTHIGRLLDLAQFLARQKRYEESEAMIERASKIAPHSPELKFKQAKIYIQSGRNREEARRLLQQYMESSLTPDDPSKSEAEHLLKEAAKS